MAYNGQWLVKVGNYIIPNSLIQAETYKAVPNVQDMDSYADANGDLHRTALTRVPIKVEFNIRPMLSDSEIGAFFDGVSDNYTIKVERKANVTCYVPEYNDYVTQEMYMAQPEPEFYGILDGVIRYQSFRIAFISYKGTENRF